MQPRAAKNNALKAIKSSTEIAHNEDTDVEFLERTDDANKYSTPIYTQNAPKGYTLDLFKQYKRKIEFCDRDLIKIHDKSSGKKAKGSEDGGLIYVDFQAGMFEALKVNFIKCIETKFNTKLIAEPKIECYGEALERDLRMNIQSRYHDVKIKVHNTKCSLDVAAFHAEVGTRFEHLNDLTVGEYFARHVISPVVEIINENVDISKLNEHLRYHAIEGKKSVHIKTVKKHCSSCEKEIKGLQSLTCTSCKELFHISCLSSNFSNEKDMTIAQNFTCGNCLVYPDRFALDSEEDPDPEQQLVELKLDALLPTTTSVLSIQVQSPSSSSTGDIVEQSSSEKGRISEITSDENTSTETEVTDNSLSIETNIRGEKRVRSDTSLVFDARSCNKCEQLTFENKSLKEQIKNLTSVIEEGKVQYARITKELADTKIHHAAAKDASNRENNTELMQAKADLKKKNEEYEMVKQMIVDRDKSKKKTDDAFKREINELKIDKKASDDALSRATAENVKLKDKETTLIDIFKYLKQNIAVIENANPGDDVTVDDVSLKHYNNCANNSTTPNNTTKHLQFQHTNTIEQDFSCDECDFRKPSEEDILNHKIAAHSKHYCNKCGFVTESISDLMNHFHDEHTNTTTNQTIFKCRKCPQTFDSKADLHSHISIHSTNFCRCDYCGFKTQNIEALDVHIQSFHKINKSNQMIRQNPCMHEHSNNSVRHPSQTKVYSSHEKLENGPCRNWNEGFCRFNTYCKYAHVKICKFQERCLSSQTCRYYHNSKNNLTFLSRTSLNQYSPPMRQRGFQFRIQDFPPLQQRNHGRRI